MMKKLISGLVLLAMLACLVLPAAAAEPTAPSHDGRRGRGRRLRLLHCGDAGRRDLQRLSIPAAGPQRQSDGRMRQDYLASLAEKAPCLRRRAG